jgi:hypothetical protein
VPDQFGSCCKAVTKDGRPCKAPPTEGGLCFFHANPDRVRQLGQIGGRKNRRRSIDPSELGPLGAAAVRQMLAQTIFELQQNKVSPRSAAAMAQVSSVLLRAIQASELEERVAELERALAQQNSDCERHDSGVPSAAGKKEGVDGS